MFENRTQAGYLLARELLKFKGRKDCICLGIPRGGVEVAGVIAKKLDLPLDIIVTRKIPAPNQEELAIGAVGPSKVTIFDKNLIRVLKVKEDYIQNILKVKEREIKNRLIKFRGKKKNVVLKSKTVILIDDGIATGSTIKAAIKYLKKVEVRKIVLAVPVAPISVINRFKKIVDELNVLKSPKDFYAVGQFYRNFEQVSDKKVKIILNKSS